MADGKYKLSSFLHLHTEQFWSFGHIHITECLAIQMLYAALLGVTIDAETGMTFCGQC